jgi:HPP family
MSSPTERPVPRPKAIAPAARDQVAAYLGVLRASLRELASALILVAERHERNYEIWGTATVLAGWIHDDDASLDPFAARYGIRESDQPHKLRAALLGGVRGGLHGLLADLTDLSVLAEQADMAWTVVYQAGKEIEDQGLLEASGAGRGHAERTIRWIRTQVDHTAPEALAVGASVPGSVATSLPKGPDRMAAIPDPVWGPLTAGVLVLVAGALGLLFGRPWLLPSLGPTAVLVGEMPAHPVTRAWNTIVGHLGGLLAGAIGVVLAGAASQPVVLVDHVLTPQRLFASVIAIALTAVLGALLRASHPPAAATTLLVSLGSLRTLDDALNLMAGVLVIAVVGALFRDLRIHRLTPGERMAPPDSSVRRFLRSRVG